MKRDLPMPSARIAGFAGLADEAGAAFSGVDQSPDTAIVLVHGSMMGGWIWERVTPLLTRPAIVVDLPGRAARPSSAVGKIRLKDAAESIARDVDTHANKSLVLVGHSLGGVAALAAASRLQGRVEHLVFMSSVVPRDGKSWVDELPLPNRALLKVVLRLQRKGARAPERSFRATTAHDVDDKTVRDFLVPRLVPEAPRLFLDRVAWGATREIPRTYVRLTEDRDVALHLQNQVIDHLQPVDVVDVRAGHLAMITKPTEVADALNRVAEAAAEHKRLA